MRTRPLPKTPRSTALCYSCDAKRIREVRLRDMLDIAKGGFVLVVLIAFLAALFALTVWLNG